MSSFKKARAKRFVGYGNVKADGRTGWQLTCSKCASLSKVIHTGKNSSLSPPFLIKKFAQAGWEVGAHKDVCPECLRKTVSSHVPFAKQTIADLGAPMVKDAAGKNVHFNELKATIANLDPEQAKQIIEAARERIPSKPKREKKPPKPEQHADPDYERWLNEEDEPGGNPC
jgi:hypothetical protein